MKPRPKAFVLVEVLVVIACLVALMAMIVADEHVAWRSAQDRMREQRAEAAMRSGVARAMAVLQDADTHLLSKDDDWYTLGDNGDIEFETEDGAFRIQLVDAGSLINLNNATEDQLNRLPLDSEQVDSLLDWRERGSSPRSDGAKDTYYNMLPVPYNATLGTMTSVSELLLVKGWTAHTLYQPVSGSFTNTVIPEDDDGNRLPLASMLTVDSGAPATQPSGSARINFDQRPLPMQSLARLGVPPGTVQMLANGAPYTSFNALLSRGGLTTSDMQSLLNAATFGTSTRWKGKIDINTASKDVLLTIPDMPNDVALAVVSQQTTGFTSLGQLATLAGVSTALLPKIADYLCVGSDTWIVRAYGKSGGIGMAVEAVVRVTNGKPQIISWDRQNGPGIPKWWGWRTNATSTMEAGSST